MAFETEAILPSDAPDFILNRVFAAPRPLLYQCFMDPSHLSRWYGPRGFTCPDCEMDARTGGRFKLAVRSPDGTVFPMTGKFLEIIDGEKVVKEDDVSGHPEFWFDLVDPARKGQVPRKIGMTTTLSFADHPEGSKLTVATRFDSVEMRDNFAKVGLKDGWSSSFEKLDDLTNALKGDAREINITRLIKHPIARVFAAFSNPAGMALWWGPDGFRTTTHSMSFKVGGSWTYTMHGPDGTDYPNYVHYTRIETNALIAYDHGTDAGHPALFKAEIRFAPEGDSTRVTLKLILADASQRPGYVAFGAVEGGYQNLARLEKWLDGSLQRSNT
jgi:uncharacterized protein YndB with AHSA1/START domain